ncbi:MAG: hypothetical protein Q7J61_03215, partial [Deltaproteobacteria bacterium]|nr:hypothetical protein [Deltaproteobacteria bacterium]
DQVRNDRCVKSSLRQYTGRSTDKIPYHFCTYYYFCDKVSYNEIESSVKQIHITFRRTSRKWQRPVVGNVSKMQLLFVAAGCAKGGRL